MHSYKKIVKQIKNQQIKVNITAEQSEGSFQSAYGFEQHEIWSVVLNLHGNMDVCNRPFCVTFSRVCVCVKTSANSPFPRPRRPSNI